ncbi:glutamic acid-rich protein-like [Capsicum galapagoense]
MLSEEKQEAEKEKKVEEAPAATDAEKEGEQGENQAAAADVEKKGDKAEDGKKEAAYKEEGEQKEEKEEAHQKDVVMDIIDDINSNICVDNIPHTLLIWRW